MTDIVPLRAGEVLVPKPGLWTSFMEVETYSSRQFKGKTYWWVEMTSVGGASHLDTLSEDTLRKGFVRKPSFYRVGKKYKFRGLRDTIWTILDVYVIDPDNPNSESIAVARKSEPSWGGVGIERLTKNDFSRMEEV